VPIYMNWGDTTPPKIKGDVRTAGHAGWIELTSAQVGLARSAGGSADRSGSAVKEMVVTKATDATSSSLIRESLQGTGTRVRINFVDASNGSTYVYQQVILTDVLVSGYSLTAGAPGKNGQPQESISLNFTGSEWGPGQGVTPHPGVPKK
jgi:type VI protein secretion system component Hcp